MKSYCDKCQTEILSKYILNNKGHIENLCNACGTRRGLNPYITRKKFDKLVELNVICPDGTPKGEAHANTNR